MRVHHLGDFTGQFLAREATLVEKIHDGLGREFADFDVRAFSVPLELECSAVFGKNFVPQGVQRSRR